MTDIRIKRVYEPQQASDGLRVLVDRMWPRGVKKESLSYDLWAKEITPSTPLRKWFHQDEAGRWSRFRKKYTRELEESPAIEDFLKNIESHDTVTLLYGSKNAAHNHAIILRDFIEKRLG